MKRKAVIITMLLFILASCAGKGKFNNMNEAKQAFLSEEGINDENIINVIDINNGHLLVFEKHLNDTSGYAVAYFKNNENKTVDFIGSTAKIAIDKTGDGRSVGTELVVNDNQKIYFHIGEYEKSTFNNKSEEDIEKGITRIDEDRGIYYIIDVEMM